MRKFTLLLLVFNAVVHGQFKGIVKDSVSGKPIAYLGIWSVNTDYSFSTDENGRFETIGLKAEDKILFFASGYELKKMRCNLLKNEIVLIPKKVFKTGGVIMKKTLEKNFENDDLTSKQVKQSVSIDSITHLIAQFVPYKNEYQNTKYLKNIQFSIKNYKKNSVYKVRFFEADSAGKPSKEIVNEDIIGKSRIPLEYQTDPSKHYSNIGNKEIDLLNYNIIFPKNGIYIAVELMYLKENDFKVMLSGGKKEIMKNPFVLVTNTKNDKIWEYHHGEWLRVPDGKEIGMKLILTN